jgi:hypothetical protein
MKQLAIVAMLASLVWGCGSSESSNYVPTEIPTELSGNTDVQEYFETFDLLIAEYITMAEGIVKAGKEAEDSEEDMGFAAAMNMMSSVASSAVKMAPLLEKLDELEKKGEVMQGELTGEELEAFIATYSKMMMRIMDMSTELNGL